MTKFSGLEFAEKIIPTDDAAARAEILLLAPSMLVPCLKHDGISVWDTLAIAEYLNESSSQGRPGSERARTARAVPLDLRRNAFGIQRAALGAPDESERPFPEIQSVVARRIGHRAHHDDLA